MPEPRTHYQVSFTSRQAVLLFVVVLAALTGAFFLGVVTGLAGRQPSESPAVSVSPSAPTAPAAGQMASGGTASGTPPSAGQSAEPERTAPPAVAAREPGKPDGLQFFEDRPEPTPAARATSRPAAAPAKAAGGFWVQVLSTTSEREANSRRALFTGHGYRTIVETARSPKGPVLYRVRVGPYASREEASKAAEALERREKAKTWIVPPGE